MNSCYVVADGLSEFNSSNYRCAIPATALIRAGHTVNILNVRHWMQQSEYAKSVLQSADIIHLQRVLLQETHKHVDYWRSRGKAVIVDFDDYYPLIEPTNAAAKFWKDGYVKITLPGNVEYSKKLDPHPLDQFREGLRHCTAAITPSYVMQEDFKEYCPVYTVENYLDEPLYRNAPKHDNGDLIVIGWGGSLSHTQSWEWSGIQDAIKQVLQERNNVRLLLVGDERIPEQVPMDMSKVWFSPYTSWWMWQKTLKRYDIGLAPLSGDYDDRRSSLKVAEYIISGIPFIATRSPVYKKFFGVDSGDFVEHGHDMSEYAGRVEDWYRSTIDIIDNLEEYRHKAEHNIMTEGINYSVDRNVDGIVAVYEEIIDLEK